MKALTRLEAQRIVDKLESGTLAYSERADLVDKVLVTLLRAALHSATGEIIFRLDGPKNFYELEQAEARG